ncbi:MAG: hypothetical protein GYB35_14895 [Algicola sp.]|nr:hypothetical protein [Algicola sp.]
MMRDPLTNEEFEPKRSNQRFARPQNRIKYYNLKANLERKENAFFDKPLKKNLKVLNELMEGKTDEVFHKEFLKGKGYDFNFYHATCRIKNTTGYCIYNYVLIFNNNEVNILRNN